MDRPYGFHPAAFQGYVLACYKSGVDPDRISQTIGNAPASKGTHARDNYALVKGIPRPYSAATDISVRGLDESKIKILLEQLARQGFIAWYRHTGSFAAHPHIHMVWAGCRMKRMLRDQFHDFVNGRTGLVGHGQEEFWTPTVQMDNYLRAQFFKFNPVNG